MPATTNPFFETWTAPFGVPPFGAHRAGAFHAGLRARLRRARRRDRGDRRRRPTPPTFANTIEALERSGQLLDRVVGVFFNLAGADTNDALLAIEREISPQLAAHWQPHPA